MSKHRDQAKSVIEKIQQWYEGEYVVYESDPHSPVIFIGGDYRRHWTAAVARVLVEFWLAHWKWIIGSLIAIAAVVFKVSK